MERVHPLEIGDSLRRPEPAEVPESPPGAGSSLSLAGVR